jgi:tRNA 2-thiouridine synthesizing protein A
VKFDKELDARGLNCPLPILRTKKSLTDMTSGQVLKIVATDPGSVKDFQAFSKQTGNELLASETANNEFIFFMKRK